MKARVKLAGCLQLSANVAPMRGFVLGYGVLAYLYGIRSLVYFVFFACNVPWVKTVDSGQISSGPLAFAVDTSLLATFALSHSLMARGGFKEAFVRRFPEPILRSTYVLVASLLLSLLMWQWRPVDLVIWDLGSRNEERLLMGLAVAGWVLAAIAYYSIGHLQLMGLQQAYRHFQGKPPLPDELVTTGVYRYLRNPMYLGFVIGMWSTPRMTAGRLLLAAGMTLYILIGLRYERRDLHARFGDRYLNYLGEWSHRLLGP
jgi:protein-S-isoprenylcysteine O-methyltransferase Ste14